MKNKVKTLGYFKKRLRDNGFIVLDVFRDFSENDKRKWTVVVNPGTESVFITCQGSSEWPYRGLYNITDAGEKVPQGFYINTDSVDVIVKYLIEFKISNQDEESLLNTINGRKTKKNKGRAGAEQKGHATENA